MDGWYVEERSWLLLMVITSLESLEFLAFTLSSVTLPVISLCPWCPCNKMMINDRERRWNLDCIYYVLMCDGLCVSQDNVWHSFFLLLQVFIHYFFKLILIFATSNTWTPRTSLTAEYIPLIEKYHLSVLSVLGLICVVWHVLNTTSKVRLDSVNMFYTNWLIVAWIWISSTCITCLWWHCHHCPVASCCLVL